MSDQRGRGISWTNETWNVLRGCRRKNKDCNNCYAELLAATRLVDTPKYRGLAMMTAAGPRWTGKIQLDEGDLLKPLGWQRPRMVFVNAMSDIAYEELSPRNFWRIVGVMAVAHRHTFQALTKRPERLLQYFEAPDAERLRHDGIQEALDHLNVKRGGDYGAPYTWPRPNIWWGASMGHQAAVDAFMPNLIACRRHAAVLWVSAEPLLEALDWTAPEFRGTNVNRNNWLQEIDWMVGGGESGRGNQNVRVTPYHAALRLRDDCQFRTDMGRPWPLPFHWKQWGEWLPTRQGDSVVFVRVGKKAAGHLIDGVEHREFPRRPN